MTVYCAITDVEPLISTLGTLRDAATGPPAVTATVPSATQAVALIATCGAEIDGALAVAGYELPITGSGALNYLATVNAYGAAAFIYKVKYPAASGAGGDAGAAEFWSARYAACLESIKAGAMGESSKGDNRIADGFDHDLTEYDEDGFRVREHREAPY